MKRSSVLIAGGLVLLVAIVFVAIRANNNKPVAAAIRTATVTRGDIAVTVSATGAVTATSQVDVRSRATGTVTQVSVTEGVRVNKGELLATIDDPDARASLSQAQAQVAQANANLASALAKLGEARQTVQLTAGQSKAAIAQAQAAVATAKARLQTVKSGARPEQVAQAKQAVAQAQANLDFAKMNRDRQQQLFNQGFVPRATLDQAQTQYQVSLAQLRSAQQQLQLLQAGPLPSDVAAAEAEVRQAEAQLANAQAGAQAVQLREQDVVVARATVAQMQAQLAAARAQLQSATERYNEGFIRAPIAGVVAKRSLEVGQTVIGGTATSGTSVFTLADITPLLAAVNVDETDIAKVQVGMPVNITVDALPGAVFRGEVQRIAPAGVVVQNVNQYTVTVEIKDPTPALKLGMTLNIDFVIARARTVLLVPSEAIRGKEDHVVFIVGQHDALTPQLVVTGITNGRLTELKSGVQEGQRVYLGPAQAAPQGAPQPANPFQPNFQRRPPGGGR